MKPKEHFWSDEIVELIETAEIKMSNRVSISFLNRLLHRDDSASLKLKTISEMCDRHGNEILDYQEKHARAVLLAHHFNPVTGEPLEGANIESLQASDSINHASSELEKDIDDYITSYNENKKDGITIQMTEKQRAEIESPDEKTVYIALDGVGVKRQKDKREKLESEPSLSAKAAVEDDLSAAPKQKGRPSVETSVAHINVGKNRYVLLTDDMTKLCLLILAFLLEFDLLKDHRLVFLADGAGNIKSALENIFSFRQYTILLDWFHLRKHCSETVCMMLRAGKENRDSQYRIKRTIFRYLWCGNVQGAIAYIRSLTSNDIRNENRRKELIAYLERKEYAIQCYAVRRHLGLTTTSNPVEKANDLTVASRQKKKCMSWSRHGSLGLAALTALYMNHEDNRWHKTHNLCYEMYEKYGSGMAA